MNASPTSVSAIQRRGTHGFKTAGKKSARGSSRRTRRGGTWKMFRQAMDPRRRHTAPPPLLTLPDELASPPIPKRGSPRRYNCPAAPDLTPLDFLDEPIQNFLRTVRVAWLEDLKRRKKDEFIQSLANNFPGPLFISISEQLEDQMERRGIDFAEA